jgi:hypothetical protein
VLGADEVGTALPPVLSYCGNLGRAMWPRSAHFLVLPKVLPSSACPFPKKRLDQIAAAVPPIMLLHAPTSVGQATALTTQRCALVLVDRASLAHDIKSSAI